MHLYPKVGHALSKSRAASPYYKLEHEPLQSEAGNLLQSGAIVITKRGWFFKLGQLYYKERQSLQSKQYIYTVKNKGFLKHLIS